MLGRFREIGQRCKLFVAGIMPKNEQIYEAEGVEVADKLHKWFNSRETNISKNKKTNS